MIDFPKPLRVAVLAANLSQGGAEKQLVYMARALQDAGVTTRIYSLTRGQHYESILRTIGLEPVWVGRRGHPLLRLKTLARHLQGFRPEVIQSTHSFANLYAGLLGRLLGAVSVGALRCSLQHCREGNGPWTRWLVTLPTALIVNSQTARDDLLQSRLISQERVFLLPNAIELEEYDRRDCSAPGAFPERTGLTAGFVGRLIGVKRPDRFLRVVALAAKEEPTIRGLVVGDGPERASLEKQAVQLGLKPHQIRFLGQRPDVPRLLQEIDVLVHCSEDEGLPNVVLEAMAARLPVITTPAGDAKIMVEDGHNGYVVPFDDITAMAERLVQLARKPSLKQAMGHVGRQQVERQYSYDRLADRLLSIYHRLLHEQSRGGLPCD
jgi:glycosyltransferase involved in cell wall biosynthesis